MSLGRISLIIAAASFVVFGMLFLFTPVYAASFVGVELPVSSAKIDIRSTYGGYVLGTAIFFAWCAMREAWLRVGLVAQAAVLGGFIFGRIVGIVVDGEPNAAIYVLLAGEIAGCVLALVGLKKQR